MTASDVSLWQNDPRLAWMGLKFKAVGKEIARRNLESKLAKIIVTANGHRTKNVPRYAPVYGSLYRSAEDHIAKFCTKYDVPELEIYSQLPAMKELKDWAMDSRPSLYRVRLAAMKLFLSVIGVVILGLSSGLIQRLFHFGWMLSQRW
jgi:hypothetical protein